MPLLPSPAGIFTTVALFLYMLLTQWHLHASGVGALTTPELCILYTCAMGCVKLLPLGSIGLAKVDVWGGHAVLYLCGGMQCN